MSQASVKRSELHKRLVIDRQTSENVGHLSDLLLDAPSQKIVGFYCGGGLFGGQRQAFSWDQIESIGADSIVITGQQWEPDFDGTGPMEAPIGHELWTDTGNRIGKVTDLLFDPENGNVVHYIFTSKGWQSLVDGTYRLPPVAVSSIGSKRIIALETMMANPQQHQEGLGQKAENVAEFLKKDYRKTKEDLEALKQGAQNAVDQVKEVLPVHQESAEDDTDPQP